MDTCPVNHQLRRALPRIPPRILKLPIDPDRGYPVPFFVQWINGKPDYRIADSRKYAACIKLNLCWICGEVLGSFKTFPIGPMCSVTRTTSEPPAHLECAIWSVKACPFLSKPVAKRRVDEVSTAVKEACAGAGISIDRNPGVTCVWTSKTFKFFPDGKGKLLIEVGEPDSVTYWREGRPASRAEVLESIESGIPLLLEHCPNEGDTEALMAAVQKAKQYLPK